MKRKFIAVMLSLSMCVAPVCEAGAADFCAPEEGDSVVDSEEMNDSAVEDAVASQGTETEAVTGVDAENLSAFSDGETDLTDGDSFSATEEIPFSSGEDVAEENQTAVTVLPDANGTVRATAEDWVKVGSRFKLKKESVPVATPTPIPTPVPENPDTGNQEAGQTADISGEGMTEEPVETGKESDDQTEAAEASMEVIADISSDTENSDGTLTQEGEIPVLDEEQASQAQAGEYTDTYYTSADGIVRVTTTYKNKKHTGYYYFDANGYMVTGRISIPTVSATASYAAEIDTEEVAAASLNMEVAETETAEVLMDSPDAEEAQNDFSAADEAAVQDAEMTPDDAETAENIATEDVEITADDAENTSEAMAEIVPEDIDSEAAEAVQADAGTVQYYFTTSGEAAKAKYAGCENETVTPYTSPIGQQRRNTWLWTKTVFEYYGTDGAYMTVAQLNAKYKAENKYTGYFKIGEDYYCLNSAGLK